MKKYLYVYIRKEGQRAILCSEYKEELARTTTKVFQFEYIPEVPINQVIESTKEYIPKQHEHPT